MRILVILPLCFCAAAALADPPAAAPPPAKGWMDVGDCPAKRPGPWRPIKDNAAQAALRKELAGQGRIAFSSNRDGNWEIYSCNPDGSDPKNLTRNAAWDIYPRWTPDGRQIVFFSDRDAKRKIAGFWGQLMERPDSAWGPWRRWPGYYDDRMRAEDRAMGECGVYVMDADGSNVRLVVKNAQNASISPDGRRIVFERAGKAMTCPLAGGPSTGSGPGPETFATHRYFGAAWWPEYSPDGGRLLVATSGDTVGVTGVNVRPPPEMMATSVDLKDGHAAGPIWNLATGGMNLGPRWRPDGNGVLIVQGSRELRLQEIDLTETPNENGWLVGKTIGLATPADRFMHAFPAYCPAGRYVAFSLSPIHYLVRDKVAPLGYKPWKDGNQIVWQELCVGRAVPGADNVWIQLTADGCANRDADWWVPPDRRIKPAAPITAAAAAAAAAKKAR